MTGATFAHLNVHHRPLDISDRIALGFTKMLRFCADTFFAKRYGHRAIVLETVAAVPGMVGATLTHLKCLRRMEDDKGWIRTLMEEAENERMHLMTFIEVAKPSVFERMVILGVQWVFYLAFFALFRLLQNRRAAFTAAAIPFLIGVDIDTPMGWAHSVRVYRMTAAAARLVDLRAPRSVTRRAALRGD